MTKLLIEREIIERVLNVMEMEGCAGLAADAVREALAKQAEPSQLADASLEPVAWMYEYGTDRGDAVNKIRWYPNLSFIKPSCLARNVRPLYAAPVSIKAAVLAEREACAKLFADEDCLFEGKHIAAAIRSRSNEH